MPPKTGPGVMLESGHLDAIERGSEMSKKRHTPEQVINKLRQAEVELSNGATVAQTCKKIGVAEQTYYRWRSEYGGMRVDQAKRLEDACVLQELERENAQLKKLVAEQRCWNHRPEPAGPDREEASAGGQRAAAEGRVRGHDPVGRAREGGVPPVAPGEGLRRHGRADRR